MLRQDGQSSDVQPELARLAELAQTRPQGQEVVARDGAGHVGEGEPDVVDAVPDQAEDVAVGVGGVVERGDQVLERGACVVCQFGKQGLRFLFC